MNKSAWLIGTKDFSSAPIQLFCFHHAGGSASVFRRFRELLQPQIELVAIELPGRGSRFKEPLSISLVDLIAASSAAINSYARDRFVIYGHSIGALLAFEVATQLTAMANRPDALIVSGRRAPPLASRPFFAGCQSVDQLTDAQLTQLLEKYAGTPPAILQDPGMLALYLPVIRQDFGLDKTYVFAPEVRLTCPLYAYGGQQDSLVNAVELQAWTKLTDAHAEARMLTGGHFFPYDQCEMFCRELRANLSSESFVRTG